MLLTARHLELDERGGRPMLETLFDELCITTDAQEKERLIRELAQHPQETLDEAMKALKGPPKSRWEVAAQVIRAIGYPHNAPAISLLIGHIGDPNSPAWVEAVKTLEEMGPQVVIPYLLADFWQRDRVQYWDQHIEGICFMLCQVERIFALQCGPALAHLLGRNDLPPDRDLDRGFLLDVLEKIGPDCAEYALPVLIDFISKEGNTTNGMQALRLVQSFDQEILERYQYVLAPLLKRMESQGETLK